jgi:hypothetical protein
LKIRGDGVGEGDKSSVEDVSEEGVETEEKDRDTNMSDSLWLGDEQVPRRDVKEWRLMINDCKRGRENFNVNVKCWPPRDNFTNVNFPN